MNIEILRNTLYKAYLDDFAAFCNKLGGATAEVMGDLLAFEVLHSSDLTQLPVSSLACTFQCSACHHQIALQTWDGRTVVISARCLAGYWLPDQTLASGHGKELLCVANGHLQVLELGKLQYRSSVLKTAQIVMVIGVGGIPSLS